MKVNEALPRGEFAVDAAKNYGSDMHRYLVRRLRQPQDAEDLAQEVYMRLMRVRQVDLIRNPKAYIWQVVGQVLGEFIRQGRISATRVIYDTESVERQGNESTELATDGAVQRLCTQQELTDALRQLPPVHRAAILLQARYGFTLKEIAQRLNLTPRTVKRYLADAKDQLMALLWNQG